MTRIRHLNILEADTHLLTEPIPDDTGLLERRVLVEGIRQHIVRDIIAEITHEKSEPGCDESTVSYESRMCEAWSRLTRTPFQQSLILPDLASTFTKNSCPLATLCHLSP